MQDATDRMSAVFGNDQASLLIEYAGWRLQQHIQQFMERLGHQPSVFGFFPDLADDTYATIGLSGQRPVRASWVLQIHPSWKTPPKPSPHTS